eukprot:COSAG01_NODE_1851_length_9062_cov_44.766819_4_plen_111_part_00
MAGQPCLLLRSHSWLSGGQLSSVPGLLAMTSTLTTTVDLGVLARFWFLSPTMVCGITPSCCQHGHCITAMALKMLLSHANGVAVSSKMRGFVLSQKQDYTNNGTPFSSSL